MVSAFFLFRGCVEQADAAAVEKRGRFLRLAEPGVHFFNPCAGELVAGTLSTRVQSLETKTKDNVFFSRSVQLNTGLLRRMQMMHSTSCRVPQQQIQSYVFDVVRAIVPRIWSWTVFLSRKMMLQKL